MCSTGLLLSPFGHVVQDRDGHAGKQGGRDLARHERERQPLEDRIERSRDMTSLLGQYLWSGPRSSVLRCNGSATSERAESASCSTGRAAAEEAPPRARRTCPSVRGAHGTVLGLMNRTDENDALASLMLGPSPSLMGPSPSLMGYVKGGAPA